MTQMQGMWLLLDILLPEAIVYTAALGLTMQLLLRFGKKPPSPLLH